MKNYVPNNHYRYKSIPHTMKICDSLKDDTCYISFLSHARQYDNGVGFSLSTDKNWVNHHCEKYLFNSNNTKKRIKKGINYWKKNKAENISAINEDARENFDIDARIEFVYRDNINECYHLYSFVSDRKNADKAYRFYDTHRDKLLKFIAYFNREAAHLIAEANKPENLIQIPDYNVDGIIDPKRNYAKELLEENKNTELSSREFEIMLLHAYGLSPVQMGEVLCKNHRTIEWTLAKIYKKTGMRDRKSMQLYVRDNGWCGLEQFFFNYEGVPDDLPTNQTLH